VVRRPDGPASGGAYPTPAETSSAVHPRPRGPACFSVRWPALNQPWPELLRRRSEDKPAVDRDQSVGNQGQPQQGIRVRHREVLRQPH
jgi:hypothetical protein